MPMTELSTDAAAAFVYAEALCLDEQRWQDWLALYADDAVYWIPSWKDDHVTTEDPATEVSFMYAAGRGRLEERVKRASGTKSIASMPLPRTLHCISNVIVTPAVDAPEAGAATGESASRWRVQSNCVTQIYDLRRDGLKAMACRYEHLLAEVDGALRIARKKIVLINDNVPTVLDFYCV
jgi:3-phenylpropionate/cinnamic acid dioxygenase small subunit